MNLSAQYPQSTDAQCAVRSVNCALDLRKPRIGTRRSTLVQRSKQTPRTSEARRHASTVHLLDDSPSATLHSQEEPQTFLYLAYGSNLCAETFRGKRNIKPLSQINVVVPELSLTFNLAGIPYTEPCFGNCRYRTDEKSTHNLGPDDYHKDRWHKGLVGCVYEVTAEDYAHIIATEGGGAGYTDVLVDCHPLDEDPNEEVPWQPTNPAFKAHTLFAPPAKGRPDPSYAQPSARYKKLITDGAEELDLPHEYRVFLDELRTYRITTVKQQMGLWIFSTTWLPILALVFIGNNSKIFLRPDGTYPDWYVTFINALFTAVWASYDGFFKPVFGDGERTLEDGGKDGSDEPPETGNEKTPLIERARVIAGREATMV